MGLGKSITDLTAKVDETVQHVSIAADVFAFGCAIHFHGASITSYRQDATW
jgi:hypothetical protein